MAYHIIQFPDKDGVDHDAWIEQRRKGIGGSDAATVLGLNKYKSPLTLWLEKTGRKPEDDLSGNEKVYWGKTLEEPVAARFAKNHPEFSVQRRNGMYVDDERPVFADIDRMLIRDGKQVGVLEIKTADARRAEDWNDGVPDYYLPQPLHYLMVTGLQEAWVAVLIGGNDYREFKVTYDDEDIAALTEAEDTFWNYIETDTMPELVGNDDEGGSLAIGFADHDEGIGYLEEDDKTMKIVDEYDRLNAEVKSLEKAKKIRSNQIKELIGNNKGVANPYYKLTWVRSTKTNTDTKRLFDEHPELKDEYTTTSVKDGGIRLTVMKG